MVAVRKDRICRSYGAFSSWERRATKMPRRRRSELADAKRSRKSSSRICKPASGVNKAATEFAFWDRIPNSASQMD
jgi:hypothetical protein